jgi:hypothetical protein
LEAHRVVRSRGSHIFLENRLTDDGKVVSLTRQPPFRPRKILTPVILLFPVVNALFSAPWPHTMYIAGSICATAF